MRAIFVLAMLAAGASPIYAFDGPTQTKGGAPAAADAAATDPKSKAVTQAEKLLERGIKAYEEGQPNQAIRAFTTALNSGGLPNQQMARALYYRGLAYAKREMPGQAISDLTSAAWIKDGLSPAEAQAALQARAAAYRAAGISVPAPDAGVAVAGGADPGGWSTATSGSAGWGSPQAAPGSAPAAKSTSSSGGVSGFFNSIFGGGSSSSESASADDTSVTTASIGGNASPAPAVTSWSQTTEVAAVEEPPSPPAQPPPAVAPPPPPPPLPPPAAKAAHEPVETTVVAAAPSEPTAGEAPQAPGATASAPTGRYHIQIAALRSRSEAYALSVRLLSQYGQQFGSRKPQVDEKVIGSMGTFYRVRVGPYTSADESRELCTSLQANGLDCLIVMQ